MKKLEPSREVYEPWVELGKGNSFRLEPPRCNFLDGYNSGGRYGPSNAMKRAAWRNSVAHRTHVHFLRKGAVYSAHEKNAKEKILLSLTAYVSIQMSPEAFA